MPYQQLARVVLDEWRTVEHHRAILAAGSPEAALFRSAGDDLRDEYARLIEEAIAHRRPVPPPFPEHDWAVSRPSVDGAEFIVIVCRACNQTRTFLATPRRGASEVNLEGECAGGSPVEPRPRL